jgi:hypothetical protein
MRIHPGLIQNSKFIIQNCLLFSVLAGCSSEPFRLEDEPDPVASQAAVEATAGNSFRLRPGESATIDGTLLVAFRGIRQDSRCPVDVTCVWAGDAEAAIGVAQEGGPWEWASLHTGLEPRTLHSHGYAITLVDVEPATSSTTRIPPESYTVVLRAARE